MSIPAPTTPNPATVPPKLRIKELRLQNYRAFRNARLVFDDVTFLVGRNGAGKSTLMDAMSFVREAIVDSLPVAMERRGNFLGIYHRGIAEEAECIKIAVLYEKTYQHGQKDVVLYGFHLVLSADKASYVIEDEHYSLVTDGNLIERTRSNPPDSPIRIHESLRSNLTYPLFEEMTEDQSNFIKCLSYISVVQLATHLLGAEPGIGSERRLNRSGSNIGDILKSIQNQDQIWIESRLSVIIPSIKGVRAGARASRRTIEFTQVNSRGERLILDASLMSNGTLRSLGILLALRQNPWPSIVMVDEIEDSLHPFAQSVLLEAIEEMSVEFPVVVSTHNPEVLSHPSARPERVRIIQWNDGASEIRHLSKKVIEELQPPDTVGDLLRSNALWTEDEPSTCPEGDAFFEV